MATCSAQPLTNQRNLAVLVRRPGARRRGVKWTEYGPAVGACFRVLRPGSGRPRTRSIPRWWPLPTWLGCCPAIWSLTAGPAGAGNPGSVAVTAWLCGCGSQPAQRRLRAREPARAANWARRRAGQGAFAKGLQRCGADAGLWGRADWRLRRSGTYGAGLPDDRRRRARFSAVGHTAAGGAGWSVRVGDGCGCACAVWQAARGLSGGSAASC
jgi:hypothetical protein